MKNNKKKDQKKELVGMVFDGLKNAAKNFNSVQKDIAKRVGLPALERGTLNVLLHKHFPIMTVDAIITPTEYGHEGECIKLRRCRIRRADSDGKGLRAVIVRPSQHEDPSKEHWNRVELMSAHMLKDKLGLVAGSPVKIVVPPEKGFDKEWWAFPEEY